MSSLSQQTVTIQNSSENNELRKHRRIRKSATFSFFPLDEWGDKSYPAESINISKGGLSFITNRKVDNDALIILKLRIIDYLEDEEKNGNIENDVANHIIAAARVLRVESHAGNEFKVAVQFDFETHMEGNSDDVKLIFKQS